MAPLETELALVNSALDAFHARRRLDLSLERVRALAKKVVVEPAELDDETRVSLALKKARDAIALAARTST